MELDSTRISIAQYFKLLVVPPLWNTYRASLRLEEFGFGADSVSRPLIFTCLHRDMLIALMHTRSAQPTLLVSNSPDGDILVKCLGRQNYRYVRGATGDGGQRAFVALRRALEAGQHVGVAVDGPKGPFGLINDGALQLSRLSGAPVVPLLAVTSKSVSLGSWDRTIIPHFFSTVKMTRGEDLMVRRDAGESDLVRAREQLRKFFGVKEGGP
ncbi:MAG: lysophospholipid acyltransferase (LPLAT)-like uncharacterized protein [Candidatus Krumholzibacteriia bacterium]